MFGLMEIQSQGFLSDIMFGLMEIQSQGFYIVTSRFGTTGHVLV